MPEFLYGRFTTVCLGKGFRPVSFPSLSALLGDMNGRLGPEQKADHGSIGGTNELSLGNGSQKEREDCGSIEAHLEPEWEGR